MPSEGGAEEVGMFLRRVRHGDMRALKRPRVKMTAAMMVKVMASL